MGVPFLHACQLYDQRRYDLAEAVIRRLLAESPESAEAIALLGMCRVERGFKDEGYKWATQALRLGPTVPFAHYAMAVIRISRNQYASANAAIDEAIRLDPNRASFFFMRASIHVHDRRFDEALEAAEQGLRLSPEHSGGHTMRALALERLDRPHEAEAAIVEALRLNPENNHTHTLEGWRLLQRGQHQEAGTHFLEALRINPESRLALNGHVWVMISERRASTKPLTPRSIFFVCCLFAGLILLRWLFISQE